MLAFVTSVRHPLNCFSYETVTTLLTQTVRSFCNQTSDAFSVYVVCNQRPGGDQIDPRVHFIEVGFPPPDSTRTPFVGTDQLRLDRGSKLLVGLLAAKREGATHAFLVDFDDFVSRRIAAYVEKHPEADGWLVTAGYGFKSGEGTATVLSDFNHRCGSCYIVKTSLFEAPDGLASVPTLVELVDAFGEDYICAAFGSHRRLGEMLAARGHPLTPLPFPGAVYHIGHNENHSARGRLSGFVTVPLTDELAAEFTLGDTRPTPVTLWQQFRIRLQRQIRSRLIGAANRRRPRDLAPRPESTKC